MKYLIPLFLLITLTGCNERKFKVYLYKGLSEEGRVATFDSDYEGAAEDNCWTFASLHEKAYGVRLYCSPDRY